ncbi:MAG: glycosyltransferase family 2 protein [Desulfobulbaceae bacterium]
MLISVIIPTYNRAQWIAEAVASVIHQTVPPAEVLVVDDGSTDETRTVVQELVRHAGLPIRYIAQANRGAASARNTGILTARGDYLCFLDSDDRFAPEKIGRQAVALRDSGCLISHTREQWFRRGRHLNQKKKHRPPDGDIFAASLGMCVVGMSTVMAGREVFDRYGLFDESLPCCEDYDFWLRVGCRERFHLLDLPLTIKNGGRPDQLSVRYRQGMDKFRIRSLVNLLESGTLSTEQSRLAARELERKCDLYGRGCIKHGRSEEGLFYQQLPARFR